ncbi:MULTISPECIES: hypothetical protein [unclassified Butyrivibrio]|uniref:hypothetical protein n=1 Tax=unclassified Butyrivibrio TaxID=2639466 RepID=UPI0008EEFEDE|nr:MULTISPECIES: hypothetical protein [unclassified Butyrivibrio]RKM56384.1 hypothetical protein D6853_06230 [Butyrivibrio sp. X503]SFU58677.1 hypothetical protein SAMN02910342_01018 [Butyrivibrio sp. INlla21]
MAIELHTFFNLSHYEYGEAFFGSYKGMRYRLAREPLENVKFVPVDQRGPATLMATVWPEPNSYAHTDDSLKTSENFEVSQEGLEKAVEWFNEQYESRITEWTK